MTPELNARLLERAKGCCEACACSLTRWGAERDHIFGRPPRAEESEATVWVLCPRCHFARTRNHPDASHWLKLVIAWAQKHLYAESQKRAEARLFFVDTRRAFGAPR